MGLFIVAYFRFAGTFSAVIQSASDQDPSPRRDLPSPYIMHQTEETWGVKNTPVTRAHVFSFSKRLLLPITRAARARECVHVNENTDSSS